MISTEVDRHCLMAAYNHILNRIRKRTTKTRILLALTRDPDRFVLILADYIIVIFKEIFSLIELILRCCGWL